MQVFRSLDEIAPERRPSTVTVGSFDGIHRAHQELLRLVRERAARQGAVSVAVTFDPHPLAVLAPEKAPRLLTPLPMKLELLAQSGIDQLLVLPFTPEFSRWPPERFVEEVLVRALHTESVVVGDNFRFGHRQAGTPQMLEELGRRWNFRTEILPKIIVRNRAVSSSQIRRLLEDGKVAAANRLLGRPYCIRGPIERGLGIGKRQTVPTFNLGEYPGQIPSRGVYISWARLRMQDKDSSGPAALSPPLRSVTNVGHRPTFGERELGVETHLLEGAAGLAADPAPSLLEIGFLYRLREERKFDSPEQLRLQILGDIGRAQAYFRRLEAAGILHKQSFS